MACIRRTSLSTLVVVFLAACQPSDGNAASATGAPVDAAAAGAGPAAGATGAAAAPARAPEPAAAGAELDEPTQALVKGSVGIAASVVACDMGTRAQADQGIASQRASYVERGIDGAAYDRVVDSAWQETTAKFVAATPAQKSQACASMAAFAGQLEQMAKDVEGMKSNGR